MAQRKEELNSLDTEEIREVQELEYFLPRFRCQPEEIGGSPGSESSLLQGAWYIWFLVVRVLNADGKI